uniref:Uncharacterized protein n=1 Tax=Panagrolaimus davidi TaxID=227884 RepID=A0A914QE47_9BILA
MSKSLLMKHAAENASFGINFGKEAKNPQTGSLKRKFESLMSNDLELSIKRPKFEVSVYGDNILEFNQPRKSLVNCQRLRSQHFPFRKSLMDYIVKNNPNVLRKLQKTCKYFLIKHPYLIVTDIWSDCNCTRVTIDGKQYWIYDEIDYFPKMLVAKSLRFGVVDPDYFHKWMRRILRWDIPEIEFADTCMSYCSFKNVTKSQKVVKWNSLLANVFEDKKKIHISLDLMLINLPNIVDFSIRQCHITSETTMNLNQLPWKNKIERLILYSIDGIFDPDSFYEFLVKALAPRAFLKLIFVKTLNQEKVDQLKNVLQYKLESWNPRVEKPKIMFDRFDHTTTYSSLCL